MKTNTQGKKRLKTDLLGPKESEFSNRGTPHAVMCTSGVKLSGGRKQPERVESDSPEVAVLCLVQKNWLY